MLNNLVKGNHLFDGDLVAGGVDDEEVAVDGDEQDREGGEEDAGGLDDPGKLAEDFLKVKISKKEILEGRSKKRDKKQNSQIWRG